MSVDDGGEDRLAPVIPLFGGRVARASALPAPGDPSSSDRDRFDDRDHAEDRDRTEGRDHTEPAPAVLSPIGRTESVGAHPSEGRTPRRLRAVRSDLDGDAHSEDGKAPARDAEQIRAAGEESLVRKLRARSLSVSEARQVLRGHDLDRSHIDDVIDDFCRRGYLDDAVLAEQLVISGIERKGQGRVALSRALAQRGLPRDVIDAALGDLPDDDAERALEFARTKARSMARLDFDTALRRLMGQLARRGYGGSVAMTAAKTALTEATLGKPTSGVRFVDSE